MLVSLQIGVKGWVMDGRSQFARWGLGRDTKWRSSCSKHALESSLFSVVFVLDFANTEIHSWKECKNNKERGKSRFYEILKL